MKQKIVIGIDGISYSGKTTFCNEVRDFTDAIVIIDESPKFANTKIIISDEQEAILQNSQITLQIEKERTKHVQHEKNKKIFLFDRTIFSFIAISYAYYKTHMINYFNEYIEEIIEGIKKEQYLVPDYLIFLSVSEEELKRRMLIKKKNLPNYWLTKDFSDSIEEILKKVNDFYKMQNRCISKEELFTYDNKLLKIKKEDIIDLLRTFKI